MPQKPETEGIQNHTHRRHLLLRPDRLGSPGARSGRTGHGGPDQDPSCAARRFYRVRQERPAEASADASTSQRRCFIFACDEIAEVLDKTGLNKEQKELIGQIESKLSTIARQGRAFGIHLILATQRPDANILPGQIKNNIDCRVCGRADNVLPQIILDCADAADCVPKDIPGRFLTSDGTLFQAYWFDDSKV